MVTLSGIGWQWLRFAHLSPISWQRFGWQQMNGQFNPELQYYSTAAHFAAPQFPFK
jgi:hypothetical protein